MENNIDLAKAFVDKMNDPNLPEDYTWDDFYEEMGVPAEDRSDFATAALLDQAMNKYGWEPGS